MVKSGQAFVFVVDGPVLEAMGMLLAATLRRHHLEPETRIIAYIPEGRDPSDQLLQVLDSCGVELARFAVPEGCWAKPYPHGNKLLACAEPRDVERTIFLDTDMVCLAPIRAEDFDLSRGIAAVPEGKPTWGKNNDRWDRVYAHFGMALPEDRVTLTRGRRRSFYPYFNAGFIAMPEAPLVDGKRFAELWLEVAREVDFKCPVAQKRPWLDQVTLPVTLKLHGLSYQVLPETFNFSLSNRVNPAGSHGAAILHYHRMRFLQEAPQFHEVATDLAFHLRDPERELAPILQVAGMDLERFDGANWRTSVRPVEAQAAGPTIPTIS